MEVVNDGGAVHLSYATIEILVSVIVALFASSGFWLYLEKRDFKRTKEKDLLIGIAHDRITYLGMIYITRGWVTQEEFENLHDYLYKPYQAVGGNGSASRIMDGVMKLPIRRSDYKPGPNDFPKTQE